MKIPVEVHTHASSEPVDKAEVTTVTMKNIDGLFFFGMSEGKAQLKIIVKDDVIKYNFPLGHEYVLELHPRIISEPLPKKETEPTTLDTTDEEKREDDKTAEAIENIEEIEIEETPTDA